jgi:hypothetical protein
MVPQELICTLSALGLNPKEITKIELIQQRHGNYLYRLSDGKHIFILKWFKDAIQSVEVCAYTLLEQLGVPTLPVHGRTGNALLLEDLTTNPIWRLANEDDVNLSETGEALAKWYLNLHSTGKQVIANPTEIPSFLKWDIDILDAKTILETGKKLGLLENSGWALASDNIEAIKTFIHSLSGTLTYNDFYWGNLAISRQRIPSLRVIVYDYHLLSIGYPFSDCRNVVGSLGDKAASAFLETYGPVDEREKIVDAPTAILVALVTASQMPSFPKWAEGCLDEVKNGELEKSLRRALEII